MSLAIISDIHGNTVALDAVLADFERRSVEQVVCLGDVSGTGPQPVDALERLQQLDCPTVVGNVDETLVDPPDDDALDELSGPDRMFAEIDAWCAEQLSASHEAFIRGFDTTVELELPGEARVLCYHGSPASHSDEIRSTTTEERLDELFAAGEDSADVDVDADLLVGGHTHFPFVRRYRGALLCNPGSVGLPYVWDRNREQYRNAPWAEYAVIAEKGGSVQVELCRCALDVDAVVKAALESGMPHAEQWADGWQGRS